MRTLVTGGYGFLGSNLIDLLLKNGHDILIVSSDINKRSNHEEVRTIHFIDRDTILEFKPEVVIHLAWEGGNSYADVNNISQTDRNIPHSVRLLEILKDLESKPQFIGFGTFVEYGILKEPATEETIENPINFYGLTKYCFKRISQLFCSQNNIPWTWIRPCYVYGPKDVKTRLIPSVINKLLDGNDIVLSSCDTTIDYLYVDDFCECILSIMNQKCLGVYNICSGNQYKLRDIVEYIRDQINPKAKITYDPGLDRPLSSKFVCGINQKVKMSTKWENRIDLNTGLKITIQYYNEKKCIS